jgi:L-amino acid N-acyltransferase YncA
VPLRTRPPRPEDAEAIARIYNEGIAGGLATFETRERTAADVEAWLEEGFPLVVVEDDSGDVLAWASAPPYRAHREAYRGIGDFSVYVAAEARGRGAGRMAMEALAAEARARGFWKLVSRIFPGNEASLALCRSLGFREVGVYRRHARLDGVWRDVVVVELLLGGDDD